MAEGTVGAINIEVRAKADKLDRDLRTTERKVIDSSNKMEKSLKQAFDIGKLVAGIRVLSTIADSQFNAIGFSVAFATGNIQKMSEEIDYLTDTIKKIPLLGDALGAGQKLGTSNTFKSLQGLGVDLFESLGLTSPGEAAKARAGIAGTKTDEQAAQEIQAKIIENEKRRLQILKTAEDAQKRILQLSRETALLGAKDDEARLRLQAQFKFDDATKGIAGASAESQDEIRRLANLRFKLETQAKDAGVGTGSQISARTALSTVSPEKQGPNKRQVDVTNQLLLNIARAIAAQDNRPRAQ